jgi:Fe-S-cluster-containing dehydrogenase component/DMSO reductase anchor subunit
MVASRHNFPLLEELLAEQQRLATPVAKFSDLHDGPSAPALAAVYRDLIPLSAPKPGEQYAFEVELDSCTGCKACVSACHSLNGLDETETWRDVGLVVGGDWRESFQQTVTTACHHCADPACLNGCPVLAYEKDPLTGIVRHLDDQCIGCQYCVLKCPYDVPKYNARLGIVRKCDMCHSRLADGEAPACVQACPTRAIRIVTVAVGPVKVRVAAVGLPLVGMPSRGGTAASAGPTAESAADAGTADFLRCAPSPDYTQPTTRYVSRRTQPADLHAADAAVLRPQPAHWPLAIALTLLPFAIGAQGVAVALQWGLLQASGTANVIYYMTNASAVVGWLALAVTAAHLGKPMRAWRIFLGWRKSWLSREAMVLGGWAGLSALTMAWPMLLPVAAGLGLAGLACSAMIYIDTRRVFWRVSQTVPRLFGSVITLGSAAAICFEVSPAAGAMLLAAATLGKLVCDARAARPAWDADDDTPSTAALRTARLLTGRLRPIFGARVVAALVAGIGLPALLLAGVLPWELRGLILGGVLVSDLAERYLFFRAVDAPKMPGLYA